MNNESDDKLNKAVANIRTLSDEFNKIGLEMTKAAGGNIYPVDLYIFGVINRCKHLISAFCYLIETKNFLVAAPVLRMQLDTLARLRAVWLVQDPHKFAMQVMAGVAVNKIKDANGNLMTDKYLIDEISKIDPKFKTVYERTCNFVHLSSAHIMSSIVGVSQTRFQIRASESSNDIPIESYLECCLAFFHVTGNIFSHIKGWIISKEGGNNLDAHA